MNSKTDSHLTFRSQFSEDSILAGHFHNKPHGCCIEVGAYNGIDYSNTYYFEQLGWKCILIEPVPELVEQCKVNRPNAVVIQAAVVAPGTTPFVNFEVAEDVQALSSLSLDTHNKRALQRYYGRVSTKTITVPALTLDQILETVELDQIDFITIDVEGHELEVLAGFTIDRWKPSILILERNSFFPNLQILRHLVREDYVLFRTTGVNDWFHYYPERRAKAIAYGLWLLQTYYLRRLPAFFNIQMRLNRKRLVSFQYKVLVGLRFLFEKLGWLTWLKKLRD